MVIDKIKVKNYKKFKIIGDLHYGTFKKNE